MKGRQERPGALFLVDGSCIGRAVSVPLQGRQEGPRGFGGLEGSLPPSTGSGSVRGKGRQAGFGGMSKSMPSFSVKGRGRVSGKGLYGTVFLYGYEGGDLSFVFWVG